MPREVGESCEGDRIEGGDVRLGEAWAKTRLGYRAVALGVVVPVVAWTPVCLWVRASVDHAEVLDLAETAGFAPPPPGAQVLCFTRGGNLFAWEAEAGLAVDVEALDDWLARSRLGPELEVEVLEPGEANPGIVHRCGGPTGDLRRVFRRFELAEGQRGEVRVEASSGRVYWRLEHS